MINTEKFLQGGGKTGELIRQIDWEKTEMGKPITWPESLKSALSLCLNSGFPLAIFWGSHFCLFYNDAYSTIIGTKHPWALAKPGAMVYAEIWDDLEVQFQQVWADAKAVRSDDTLLPILRYGYLEECYFDYTLSPIIAADGSVAGIFNTVVETSYRVINERRNQMLHALLKQQATPLATEDFAAELKILEAAKLDLPFSIFYTADKDQADDFTLISSTNISASAIPDINLLLKEAVQKNEAVYIENLTAYTQQPILSAWPENCTEALIVPLNISEKNTVGCLVAGISPRKKLDQDYRQFIESVVANISTDINRKNTVLNEWKNNLRLTESEDRFRSMIDQAPVAMAVYRGENFLVTKANKAMLRMTGKKENVIGNNFFEIFPELADQPIANILKDVFQTGKPYFNYNMLIPLQRNGKLESAFFDFSYTPLTDAGKITGVLVVAAEVTEQFKAQQKLQESESLFRGITAASPTTLWVTDEAGEVTYVNDTWIKWTGKPFENHLGRGWLDAVCKDDVQQAYASFTDDFSLRRYHENHFRILHENGQERSLVCTGNPQFDDQHQFKGYVGACVDITEQIQLQQQKDNFLGIASHELKTPVTSIKAYAQVLEMMFRREGDTKKADMLGKLDKQVNRLSSLISDLLDVTKIHTGRLQFNETEFDFNILVEEVIEDVQHTSSKHQIKKELRFKGMMIGDTERISQVITNLLTNAIKYSPDANEIIIYTKETDGQVQLCVQDFGIGISAHKKDLVFEQFYRVSGSKQHTFPGLGLGLYISSEIIKRLNGRIWVNSVEGKGSTFCFSLPIRTSA